MSFKWANRRDLRIYCFLCIFFGMASPLVAYLFFDSMQQITINGTVHLQGEAGFADALYKIKSIFYKNGAVMFIIGSLLAVYLIRTKHKIAPAPTNTKSDDEEEDVKGVK